MRDTALDQLCDDVHRLQGAVATLRKRLADIAVAVAELNKELVETSEQAEIVAMGVAYSRSEIRQDERIAKQALEKAQPEGLVS